jgi:hypothetical protein
MTRSQQVATTKKIRLPRNAAYMVIAFSFFSCLMLGGFVMPAILTFGMLKASPVREGAKGEKRGQLII